MTGPPGGRRHVAPHHPADELAGLTRSEAGAKVARRLTAVRLSLLGHSAAGAAAQVLPSERQVRTWVARSNAGGTAGLADAGGRKPPLDAGQEPRLAARLRAGPTPADGVRTLRGEDVRRTLREEFGVARGLQAVRDLPRGLGFKPLRPRPRHQSATAGAQAALQKSLPERVAEVQAGRAAGRVEVRSEGEARWRFRPTRP